MASIQFGAIVTGLKGKVGGQVFQGGNNGAVLRNKGYKRGSITPLRNGATLGLVSITTAWRSLTDSERSSWTSAALSYPFVNRYGITYYASAYQCFVSYNRNLTSIGLPMVNTPASPASADSPGLITVTADTSGAIIVTSANTSTQAQTLIISATAQRSPGRNSNNPKSILIATEPMFGANSWDIGSAYQAIFGSVTLGASLIVDTVVRLNAYPLSVFKQRAKVSVTAPISEGIGYWIIGSTFVVS